MFFAQAPQVLNIFQAQDMTFAKGTALKFPLNNFCNIMGQYHPNGLIYRYTFFHLFSGPCLCFTVSNAFFWYSFLL
jgi:hypothetical protein